MQPLKRFVSSLADASPAFSVDRSAEDDRSASSEGWLSPATSMGGRLWGLLLVVAFCSWTASAPALAQQQYTVELRNGLRLGPGQVTAVASISTNSFQAGSPAGEVQGMPIQRLDNGVTATYYNGSPMNVLAARESTIASFEEIVFPSSMEVATTGVAPAILGVLGVSEFSKYGRREYKLMTTRGPVSLTQGITLLSPVFAKVEVLRSDATQFAWDQRRTTSSIPAQTLREILMQVLDMSSSGDWLRMVRFYMQAERYVEARDVMEEAIRKFPLELKDSRNLLTQLEQLLSQQKFNEIKLRRQAGQHKVAGHLLSIFPKDTLPLETQVKLADELQTLQAQIRVVSEATVALQEKVAELPEVERTFLAPTVTELLEEVNLESAARLADFQRLRFDPDLPPENIVALALGGWLLGPGEGLDNLAVVKSLIRVRELVREYLNGSSPARREEILRQLQSEEGAQPQFLDKILEVMKPPQSPPQVKDGDPEGMYRLSVPRPGGDPVQYVVQLPPEYDPNRKYPCVLAMTGRGMSPEFELDWWCGQQVDWQDTQVRFGQATRHGVIVVSPDWMLDRQTEYEYSEGEHDRMLACLRDAFRKFSIDTDRVFVSGHYDGATAAWDLALSHPDLWAGAIMISPGADKYIVQYSENIKASRRLKDQIPVATYIVYGDSDGTRAGSQLGTVGTRYLSSPLYDSMVVEYRGCGRETFSSELPKISEWMVLSSHRRLRTPQVIDVTTMRSGDRFFYWLEAPQIIPTATGNAYQFDPSAKAGFEARLLAPTMNGIVVSKIPSPGNSTIVWLTPDMVDFSRTITINVQGDSSRLELSPSISVMLEDVRQRGDRMHVFWQRVAL
ncbi:carboxylesterase family protein [Aureliella helgolandensis]|uniref:Alpha/beta hydrolase family protein n=1 Tax=Aureliella helgolandensis TaxID=2527968 RepID=A0A518GF36_9BACT|nr:hypothetical protein [Aureliella helgolandensis]QDV27170.1 hypothetical protein Q31a_55580 [Aureliella helgolandensis]